MLTAANSLMIQKIAILYGSKDLQQETQQYISKNFDNVLQTDDFKTLSKEELISCILHLDRSQVKESSIFQAIVVWTKHHNEVRIAEFGELFELILLQKVSFDFFDKVILENELVRNTPESHKVAFGTIQLMKERNTKLLDESILLSVGGRRGNVCATVTAVYGSPHKISMDYPDLPEPSIHHSSVTLNNYIYCIGGCKVDSVVKQTNKVWRLNTKEQTSDWEQVASMKIKRCQMSAAVYGDVIVVAGGVDGGNRSIASTEVYEVSTNKWYYIHSLNTRKRGHALVSCEGYLYALGGCTLYSTANSSAAERLSNLKGKWDIIKPMQTPRFLFAAVNCNEIIYAIGGKTSKDHTAHSTSKTVEKYNSSTNSWEYVTDMNIERSAHAACVLHNKIYVVGGIDARGTAIREIECYDPVRDTWSIVGNTAEKLCSHTLVIVG